MNTVCLHPNQSELISGDQSGSMKIWDLNNVNNSLREEYIPITDIPIRSISIVSKSVNMCLFLYIYNATLQWGV